MQQFNHYYFCMNRQCSHRECLRHITNAEYNIIVYRKDFECTEKNKNKYMLLERPAVDEVGEANISPTLKKKRTKKS